MDDVNMYTTETELGSRPSSPLNLKIASVTCYANDIWNRSSNSLVIDESELKRFRNVTSPALTNSKSLLKPSIRKNVPTTDKLVPTTTVPTYYIVGGKTNEMTNFHLFDFTGSGIINKDTVCNNTTVVNVDQVVGGKNKTKNSITPQLLMKRTNDKRVILVQVLKNIKPERIHSSHTNSQFIKNEKNEKSFIDNLPKCYKKNTCYNFRSVGELVWINIWGRPWWPAQISVDEETGVCKRNKLKRKKNRMRATSSAIIEYHVTTFGTPSINVWVAAGQMRDFRGRKQFQDANDINFSYYDKQQILLLCGSNTVCETWEKVVKEVEDTYKTQIEELCKKDLQAVSKQRNEDKTPEIIKKRIYKINWPKCGSRRSLRIKQNQDSA